MKEALEIYAMWKERKGIHGERLDTMEETRRLYNTEVHIPLPELDAAEKPAVVNILAQGVDQLAMRVASVMPDYVSPALDPGNDASENRSRDRREAVLGWWKMNRLDRFNRRRARYLIAYGCAPVTLHPRGQSALDDRHIPHWRNRNPLVTFPAPMRGEDIEPMDVICQGEASYGWLKARYPMVAAAIYKGENFNNSTMFHTLEYMDAQEITLIVCGQEKGPNVRVSAYSGSEQAMQLESEINKAEIPLVVCPTRVTLDKVMGHFDGSIGMYTRRARMEAYLDIAVFRSIFQEQWVMSHPAAPSKPKIIQEADPIDGTIGIVENGVIQGFTPNPGQQVPLALDRMERNERVQAMLPAEFGGESASNIRTARRGSAIVSSSVDPTVQELQEITAMSMEAEVERGIAVSKAYWGNESFSFYIPKSGKSTKTDYVPNTIFDTDWSVVKFSMPGVDSSSIPIELGQRVGAGLMSKQTAREIDPLVDDALLERDRVEIEGLRNAVITGVEQQAAAGQMDPRMIARIIAKKVATHDEIESVMLAVDDEMKKEQADQAQQQQPAPEQQQPGMGAGMQGNMLPASVPPPPQGGVNLQALLATLHQPPPPPGGAPQQQAPQGQPVGAPS